MKKTLFLMLMATALIGQAKTHEFKAGTNLDLINRDVAKTVAPGDTILITSPAYRYTQLRNIRGTKEKPVVIIPIGNVRMGIGSTNYGLILEGSHYQLQGGKRLMIYNPDYCMNTGLATDRSNDIWIDGITIRYCHVGWQANPDSSGILRNYRFTNSVIHEIRGTRTKGRSEAFYVQQTAYQHYNVCKLEGLVVENCHFYDLDGDGLQVALTTGLVVKNLIVEDFGKANLNWQNIGLILGSGTSGSLSNIIIRNGRGTGMQIYGTDTVRLENVTISKVATNATDDALYIERKFTPLGKLVVLMKQVSIDTAARHGINNINASLVQLQSVSIGNVKGQKTVGNGFQLLQPAPPVDTIKKAVPLFILYSDSTWKRAS